MSPQVVFPLSAGIAMRQSSVQLELFGSSLPAVAPHDIEGEQRVQLASCSRAVRL